ncbi:nucleotide-binding protein 1, partial [Thraustotheca clavata]
MDRPTNANESCMGTQSDLAGKASGCAGCPNQSLCASGATKLPDPTMAQVKNHLKNVKHIILVLSGKGGVGKSTVSCQLAFGLAGMGHQVGLLDVDITGPSVPRMLGLTGQEVHQSNEGWSPVYVEDNLGVMSIGFMLPSQDDAIIWRGPKKSGLIKQFLTDVHWGELDYLIIDTPPGTSDEHISIVQYMKETRIDGAVVVTTPQEVAMADVRKELNFCRKTNLPVLGVVENMAGIQQNLDQIKFINTATSTDDTTNVLQILREKAPELLKYAVQLQVFPPASGGGEAMAKAFQVPFLGRLPLDANLTQACEQGVSFLEAYPNSSAVKAFEGIVKQVIALSAAKSKHVVYNEMIKDSMTNDLFWPNMSPTGAQTYLIDVFSRQLFMQKKLPLDIFDISSALLNNYDTQFTSHILWPSYPRYIVFSELTTLRDAIQGFRLFDAFYTFGLFTQYCWVDFDHRWELAHTSNRQKRCYRQYKTNGAVYIEAILRNVDWDSWKSSNYPGFMQGVGNFLIESSEGQTWLDSVPNAFQSIDNEVQYWSDKGMENFVLQWNNRIQIGLSESIAVFNAFSSSQPLTTYHAVHSSRGPSWTTFGLYWAFFDDLWAASTFNFSLVRNSSIFFEDDMIEKIYFIHPYTPASIVVHDILGPFQSIDTFYVAPSSDIIDIVTTFNSLLLLAIQTNTTLYSQYQELTTSTLDPVPNLWRQFNYNFYGGSPLCNARAATTFVQASYSFDDVCGQPKPLQITINPEFALFSYSRLRAVGESPIDSCGLCSTTRAECTVMMHQLDKIYNGLISNTTIPGLLAVTPNVTSIDVEIIQFAQLNTTSIILRQPLLQGEWSYFGYVGLYEWVYGHREVISFEGDAGIFVVLSELLDSIPFAASVIDIPNTTSQYLWAMTVTTTVVLLAVATLTIAIHINGKGFSSSHHLFFNRVAGPVWLGRPLMLLRGTTAIIILSTSPIVFDSSMGLGRFHFEPRSIFYRFLLASEASWLADVTSDI